MPPRKPKRSDGSTPEKTELSDVSELSGLNEEGEPEDQDSPGEPDQSDAGGPGSGQAQEDPIEPLDDEPEEGDEEATRAGPPLKLRVLEGPDAGKTRLFRGVRLVVGRSPECDLALDDDAISRRHFELIRGPKGTLLRDLGSGNGTKVNGQKVTEHPLEHGDEISIGKTKLGFHDEQAAIEKAREEAERAEQEGQEEEPEASSDGADEGEESPSPEALEEAEPSKPDEQAQPEPVAAPRNTEEHRLPIGPHAQRRNKSPSRKARVLVLGILATLLMLTGAFASRLFHSAPPPPPEPTAADRAAAKMQEARNAIRSDKFEEAIALVEQAVKLSAGADADGLLARASKELEAQKALEAARVLLGHAEFEKARAELAKIDGASEKRLQEKEALMAQLLAGERKARRDEVESRLRQGDLEGAKALFDQLAPEDQRELLSLLRTVEAEIESQQRQQAVRDQNARVVAAQRRAEEHTAQMEAAFSSVARKFHAGEFQRAVSECDRVIEANPGDAEVRTRGRKLQALIPAFNRAFDEGHRKFKANQLLAAARPLAKARQLYREINLPGGLGAQLDDEVVAALTLSGRDALAREDLLTAAQSFREVLSIDPSEPRAREGQTRLETKIEELFESAYMIRDRQPREAAQMFRTVLQVAAPGSPFRQKAKAHLDALTPP